MMTSSIILIDIGNTSTQTAVERNGRFTQVKRIESRRQTREKVRKLLGFYAKNSRLDGAMLCSVVPELNGIWQSELRRIVKGPVRQVSHKLNLGIKINYPRPSTIGADRLANATAAAKQYGFPVIVADFGTASTFDVVSGEGEYVGGVIVPGPMLFVEYLAEKTALLPRLSQAFIRRAVRAWNKRTLIGKSTRQAMLIGLRFGYLGLVREILTRLAQDSRVAHASVCATGGYAELILAGTDLKINIDPFLTLRGISRIYRLNS